MENLPVYISIVFLLTTALTIGLLFKASNFSRSVMLLVAVWLIGQSILALTQFYTVTNTVPPRFALLLLPPLLLILILVFSKRGQTHLNQFSMKWLTLLHVVRVPVELVLFWLTLHKVIPTLMTFEGRNFDILAGLSAPFIFYFGFVKNQLPAKALLAWNLVSLGLLINIVVNGILSVPTPFQKFALDQPAIALLYFPFVLLPGFIVPAVLFSHVAAIRQLLSRKNKSSPGSQFSKPKVS